MSKQLEGKTAIVTGAGSGIGRAIALKLAGEGARVVLAGRTLDKLQDAQAEIAAAGGESQPVTADVTSEDSVIALFKAAVERYGRLDILVNNAGAPSRSPTDTLELSRWNKVIATNLTGAFLCSREAFRLMKPQKGGRIINIGSVSALVPRNGSAAYAASKFGLEGLTRAMAIEGREFGVAVSVVQPGNTMSSMKSGREDQARAEGLMEAEHVARVVLVMAALPPEVNLYTGVILPVSMPLLGRG